MKRELTEKHRLNVADIITLIRMMGTMALVFLRPLSPAFLGVYALTGLTDVLDGWIARKTKTASDFGARLDSMADLLFYAVMLLRIFPILWNTLPGVIWYAVAVILILRISAYLTAMVKYRQFASLHTYLNKLTGGMLFLVPFVLFTEYAVTYCWIICVIAAIAAMEELMIHLQRRTYRSNTKSIFQREC
ncbi:MAG: CDP-alcohol phosphatidyltransferase family protein [Acetatifactor sp.]